MLASRAWNVEFIRHDFCNEDAVYSHFQGDSHVDRWIWHFDVKVRSVESGYHLALERRRMREPAALILKYSIVPLSSVAGRAQRQLFMHSLNVIMPNKFGHALL